MTGTELALSSDVIFGNRRCDVESRLCVARQGRRGTMSWRGAAFRLTGTG